MTTYGVSWLRWDGPVSQGRNAPKKRCSQTFKTAQERAQFLAVEKEKDDFLYILAEWEDNILS